MNLFWIAGLALFVLGKDDPVGPLVQPGRWSRFCLMRSAPAGRRSRSRVAGDRRGGNQEQAKPEQMVGYQRSQARDREIDAVFLAGSMSASREAGKAAASSAPRLPVRLPPNLGY